MIYVTMFMLIMTITNESYHQRLIFFFNKGNFAVCNSNLTSSLRI